MQTKHKTKITKAKTEKNKELSQITLPNARVIVYACVQVKAGCNNLLQESEDV